MEYLRRQIEIQIQQVSGGALGQVDFEHPAGDPGLFGPGSMPWEVHRDFTSMLTGGVAALLLQMLHPLALAGVWDHSNFRTDMLGRLRRTGLFVGATTYGPTASALGLIERVRVIHEQVRGIAPDGRPYAASDPDLLTWVHVAEVSCFLAGYMRYFNPTLPRSAQDRYYAEIAQVAERLGARNVPKSLDAVQAYLEQMRPQLAFTERTRDVCRCLLHAPAPSAAALPVGRLITWAGIDLLPEWVREQLRLHLPDWRARAIRQGVRRTAPVLRWALQRGAARLAHRRMELPPPPPQGPDPLTF